MNHFLAWRLQTALGLPVRCRHFFVFVLMLLLFTHRLARRVVSCRAAPSCVQLSSLVQRRIEGMEEEGEKLLDVSPSLPLPHPHQCGYVTLCVRVRQGLRREGTDFECSSLLFFFFFFFLSSSSHLIS